jgi:aminotransferase in exopolysaccharide biosynthesis
LAGVKQNHEVITQPLSFVATCNAISYCGAKPIFVDVDKDTCGLSPSALKFFLEANTFIKSGQCFNKSTGKVIKACIPMHTFGNPCRIDEIRILCDKYNIYLIEDAAESLGSFYKKRHSGSFGDLGIVSFNGNKIITGGGGGCIITNNEVFAQQAKHLTTTSKVPHKWEFHHDQIGYNYRMPNLNAALLVAQLEQLDSFIDSKNKLASQYMSFFANKDYCFLSEINEAQSNHWLNTLIFDNLEQRNLFLNATNSAGIMTRPVWTLMNNLPMFKDCQKGSLTNSEWLEERAVNIPSSVV